MANQKLKSVHRPCGHVILVPAYQTKAAEAYSAPCDKCDADAKKKV